MLALADSVCLLALSRSDRRVLTLLLCAGLIALCCAVLAIDPQRQHARTNKNVYINKIKRKRRLLL